MAEVEDSTADVDIKTGDDPGFIDTGAIPENIPLVGGGIKLVSDAMEGPGSDPDVVDVGLHAADTLTDCTSFVQEMASDAGDIAADPLGWLVEQGLDFLLEVVTPLQDALDFVSGDADALNDAATNFMQIGKAFESMSENFAQVSDESLQTWQGDAAKAAGKKLASFADGVAGVASKSADVSQILKASAMVMNIIAEVIKAIIVELVKWLIMIWVPALASAGPTFGGSTAAAGAATGVRAATTATQTTQKVTKLQKVLGKIGDFFRKVQSTGGQAMNGAAKNAGGEAMEGAAKNTGGQVLKDAAKSAGEEGLTTGLEEATGVDADALNDGNYLQAANTFADKQVDRAKDAKQQADAEEIGDNTQSDSRISGNLDV